MRQNDQLNDKGFNVSLKVAPQKQKCERIEGFETSKFTIPHMNTVL